MDKVSAYRECATAFRDTPELIAARRLARTIVTITEHAPREYVLVTPAGRANRVVRFIVKTTAIITVCAKREVPVSATRILRERRVAFRPVRWRMTKYVLEMDDVWTARASVMTVTRVPTVL